MNQGGMSNNFVKPNFTETIVHSPNESPKWTMKDREKPYDEIVRPSGQIDSKHSQTVKDKLEALAPISESPHQFQK